MIIWLNGGFGSGKTTLAEELHQRIPESVVYTSGIGARRPPRPPALDDPPKLLGEFVYCNRTRFGGSALAACFLGKQRFESARRLLPFARPRVTGLGVRDFRGAPRRRGTRP